MTQIIIINFGSQVAHLIARRVRELGVYSEIVSSKISINEIKKLNPCGIILSGGPSSVYEKGAPLCDKRILEVGIPVLGICYGHQLIAKYTKGKVLNNKVKEYGSKKLVIKKNSILLKKLNKNEQVWMSHGDAVSRTGKGFKVIAKTDTCPVAVFENVSKGLYGVQFHPEVVHTLKGKQILRNFVFSVCKAKRDFNIGDLKKKLINEIKKEVGNEHVIMGTSGGVDSTVASVLINKAIGSRLHCVFINHGLIRKNELRLVKERYKRLGLNVKYVDASSLFLKRLKGVMDPEKKRKIIGHTFIDVFENEAKILGKKYNIRFLGQGTIYPDRIESAQPSKNASKIKSHHNLTLPEKMKLKVIEPLKDHYKDGVRELGAKLKIPDELLLRMPFPGPGLAVRILGEITSERLRILREADHVFILELKKAGLYSKIWQAFAALFPVKTVGVMGDARTYSYVISLRAVTSRDAMTADWAKIPNSILERISNRIINEVSGVNRVVYDITQKPPGTIEYE